MLLPPGQPWDVGDVTTAPREEPRRIAWSRRPTSATVPAVVLGISQPLGALHLMARPLLPPLALRNAASPTANPWTCTQAGDGPLRTPALHRAFHRWMQGQ